MNFCEQIQMENEDLRHQLINCKSKQPVSEVKKNLNKLTRNKAVVCGEQPSISVTKLPTVNIA